MKSQQIERTIQPLQSAARRKSIRLIGHDYSLPGAYFITIVTQGRRNFFGRLLNECFHPTEEGKWVESIWNGMPDHFPLIRLDDFVVMPNHFHAILWIESSKTNKPSLASVSAVPSGVGAELSSAQGLTSQSTPSLSTIIQVFKSFSTREINKSRGTTGPVWQRGFHDHIIRNPEDLENTRNYIRLNPAKWDDDEYCFTGEGGA
jgi:REP element-mobilizing transposase RayT